MANILNQLTSNHLSLFYFLRIFLKYKFVYFNWRLITLQYCTGFAIHWHGSTTAVHVFPILNPPSLLLPHPIPLGPPSVPAPSTLSHASNLDWWSFSHLIINMFQCHSPTLTLSQSPKDYSIHLCFFCCFACGFIITTFLNSIYMHYILYWCFSFWLTSLCIIGSSFIHLIRTDSNVFFLMTE